MRNSIGYFKIWRELFDKPIWKQSTPAQKSILMTIFYLANWKENKWEWCGEPYICKEGEFVTSHNSIREATGKGITIDHVRTALKRFEKLGFLTIKSPKNKRGGIKVIINNWGIYQKEENRTNPEQIPIESRLNPEQIPTIEEDKNKRSKEDNIMSCKQDCIDILNYFNFISGRGFKPKENNLKLISARLKDFSGEELKAMIDFKVKEWKNDTKMSEYLRPKTLFGATNCESYIEQSKASQKGVENGWDWVCIFLNQFGYLLQV